MAFPKSRSLLSDTWFLEILSTIACILCLIAVIALLKHYDREPIFTWHGISLNTWVSIFTTASKSLLLFSISACLGQWKYISFSRNRRQLFQFHVFDSASRGPEGSLELLWRTRFGSLACIGAVITILSLAIDPFVQQVIGFEELQVNTPHNQQPGIARAFRYSKGQQLSISSDILESKGTKYLSIRSTADFSMQSAILLGLTDTLDKITQRVTAHCPSGSCEWQPYLSLAVCSTCTDINNFLKKTTKNYTEDSPHSIQANSFDGRNPGSAFEMGLVTSYILPNGLYVDDDDGAGVKIGMLSFGTSNRTATVTFEKNEMLLWSLTMIKRAGSNDSIPFVATECGLYYCVNNYTSRVVNGTVNETMSPVPLEKSPNSWQPLDPSKPDPFPEQLDKIVDYPLTDLQLNGKFNISQVAINGIGSNMAKVFAIPGNLTASASGFYLTGDPDQYGPDSMQEIFLSKDLNKTFAGVAASMSNSIRDNDDNSTLVLGTSGAIVYKVRWPWITLPVISVLGGSIFLAMAIWHTRAQNLNVWKSSPLAVMKLGAKTDNLFRDENLMGGMEKKAKGAYVPLFDSDTFADDDSKLGLRVSSTYEMLPHQHATEFVR